MHCDSSRTGYITVQKMRPMGCRLKSVCTCWIDCSRVKTHTHTNIYWTKACINAVLWNDRCLAHKYFRPQCYLHVYRWQTPMIIAIQVSYELFTGNYCSNKWILRMRHNIPTFFANRWVSELEREYSFSAVLYVPSA